MTHDPLQGLQFQEQRVAVAGVTARIQVAGEGPPVVYLHGANGAAWAPGLAALARSFRVYLPEHPGFGLTERPEWMETVQDVALFYLDALDALGLRDVNLVGQSLGGWIAAELASLCCHPLRRLVLVAAAGLALPGERRVDVSALSPTEVAPLLFHDRALAERSLAVQLSEEQIRAQFRNRAMTARLALSARFAGSPLRTRLRRIRVPTLVLWGAEDRLIPVAHASAYAEGIPNARRVIIEACGHLPAVERPEEFARIVAAFLQEE